MKKVIFLVLSFMIVQKLSAQQNYCDVECNKVINVSDLTGPALTTGVGNSKAEPLSFKLSQNYPNPVKETTHIRFQLNSPGQVSLKLYDVIRNPVFSLLDQFMVSGIYSIPVETRNITNGIYFYVLKKEGAFQTMRMTVAK